MPPPVAIIVMCSRCAAAVMFIAGIVSGDAAWLRRLAISATVHATTATSNPIFKARIMSVLQSYFLAPAFFFVFFAAFFFFGAAFFFAALAFFLAPAFAVGFGEVAVPGVECTAN